jgi:hypothetical protein
LPIIRAPLLPNVKTVSPPTVVTTGLPEYSTVGDSSIRPVIERLPAILIEPSIVTGVLIVVCVVPFVVIAPDRVQSVESNFVKLVLIVSNESPIHSSSPITVVKLHVDIIYVII